MNPPTLVEVLSKVGISEETLDQECSDTDLVNISQFLDWRTVAPHLGLDTTAIADVDCKRTEPEKRVETLRKWKKKFGFKATYRVLVEKHLETGNADHAAEVCRLIKQQAEDTPTLSRAVLPTLPPTIGSSTSASSGDTQGSQAAKIAYARKLSEAGSSSEAVPPSPESTPDSVRATVKSFTYLNTGKLSSQARIALESKLLKDSDSIMSEFGDLIHHTITSISSSVSVKELRSRLSSLGAYRPTRDPVPLLRNQLDEIERAEDVPSVFCILDKYYSFFNYGIIEKLIGWFGTPEDKERLETYTENFKRFCKRRTFECPPDIFGHTVDKGMTNLVVKVEESWDPSEGCSLENIRRLCNSLAEILEVEPETLYLCQINQGCVELLFQVPSFIEDIFPLSKEQERSLTSVGVTRLTCGSYRFPQPPEALVSQMSAQLEIPQKEREERKSHWEARRAEHEERRAKWEAMEAELHKAEREAMEAEIAELRAKSRELRAELRKIQREGMKAERDELRAKLEAESKAQMELTKAMEAEYTELARMRKRTEEKASLETMESALEKHPWEKKRRLTYGSARDTDPI